jgi:N6-L-threonylcarbamoyladenine synthase
MKNKPEYPMLVLVVSGGHTLLILVKNNLEMMKLGSTVDDAAGEAFDKVAKMLKLGYPGGPKISLAANKGDKTKIKFPIADTKGKYDFSFSGLKTSVLRYLQKNYENNSLIPESEMCDIAASFQKAVIDALILKTEAAILDYEIKSLSLAGGVAANKLLRDAITNLAMKHNKKLVIPSFEFCGDNAAMIALRGLMLHSEGERFSLEYEPFPSFASKYFI